MRDYLFNTEKLKYVKGDKPRVDCILCALRDHSPDVIDLEVYRTDGFIISVNLYPYNPGHIMIFPARHIEDFLDLADEEAMELHRLTAMSIRILKSEFNPSGFNLGYNIGKGSGESIAHIHQHIVPRYGNEAGFLDVIAGARIMVVDPVEMMERLKLSFRNF